MLSCFHLEDVAALMWFHCGLVKFPSDLYVVTYMLSCDAWLKDGGDIAAQCMQINAQLQCKLRVELGGAKGLRQLENLGGVL